MKVPFSVTGHRPSKLANAYPETKAYSVLVELAMYQINKLNCTHILTGMAIGWDLAVAQACVNVGISFTACVPLQDQELQWPAETKRYYFELCSKAADVYFVCDPGYAPCKIQMRNQYMVDNSEKVLALWDGSSGGTANCVEYAKTKNIEIINCWTEYLSCFKYYGLI